MVCGGCGGRGAGEAAPSRPAVAPKLYTAVDSTSRYLPGDTSSGTCTEQGTWRARGASRARADGAEHVERAEHVRTEQGKCAECGIRRNTDIDGVPVCAAAQVCFGRLRICRRLAALGVLAQLGDVLNNPSSR